MVSQVALVVLDACEVFCYPLGSTSIIVILRVIALCSLRIL